MTVEFREKTAVVVYYVTVIECVWIDSAVCAPTVNTDTETAVVNVRYAAKDQARLWVHAHSHTHTQIQCIRITDLHLICLDVFDMICWSFSPHPEFSIGNCINFLCAVFLQCTWFPPSKNQSSLIWHALMMGRRGWGVCWRGRGLNKPSGAPWCTWVILQCFSPHEWL